MTIKEYYTVDHDSSAGYGGRIGYRYKTVVLVSFESKVFNRARKECKIGGIVLDLGNALYSLKGFKSSYSPQVDTKARARKGITIVTFEYFHNSDQDAIIMGYSGYMLKHHKEYQGASSQIALNPNNKGE